MADQSSQAEKPEGRFLDKFKTTRIRRNSDVTIARCTASGRLGGAAVLGRAELLPDCERARVDQLDSRGESGAGVA
jgi:hypothetical protein